MIPWLPDSPEVQGFVDLVGYANQRQPSHASIVANSIASAVVGEFGDHHATDRTAGSKLWITPLMSMYWAFDLQAVIDRHLYLEDLEATTSMFDVVSAITAWEARRPHRHWEHFPI